MSVTKSEAERALYCLYLAEKGIPKDRRTAEVIAVITGWTERHTEAVLRRVIKEGWAVRGEEVQA